MVVDNEILGPSDFHRGKIERKTSQSKENTCKILHGNRFMDMEVIIICFSSCCCPNCSNTKLELSESKRMD